jgi:predicted translin family RNA/ssDNA-binding protein
MLRFPSSSTRLLAVKLYLPILFHRSLSTSSSSSTTAAALALPDYTNMANIQNNKPSPPLRYSEPGEEKLLIDLSRLGTAVAATFAQREAAYQMSTQMQTSLIRLRSSIGTAGIAQELESFRETYASVLVVADPTTDRTPREANLSYRVEEFACLSSFQYFLDHGTLLPPVPYATDEEYLAGAVMGLAKELEQYGLGRATVRDVHSVRMACDVVTAIFDFLLQMDFRNGPLRRQFDGVKYSVKALETLLYELAVTSPAPAVEQTSSAPSSSALTKKEPAAAKRTQLELIPLDQLQALKERLDARDELRENLIKKSRDGQKAAKQAIFALHRGDLVRADALLNDCTRCIREDLLPIVKDEAPLRLQGCFTGVLEELAKAKLFQVWLFGDGTASAAAEFTQPNTKILSLEELDAAVGLEIFSPEEYIGGLSDLTGEIGRFAVQRGTARDVESVRRCLATNSAIVSELQCMGRLPGNVSKKMDTSRTSVRKLERILYELSLSEAAGGRTVTTTDAIFMDDAGTRNADDTA